jgi:hypothetical protein
MIPGAGNALSIFQRLAKDTWNRLMNSVPLKVSQTETAFTDFNLLDLRAAKLPDLGVKKAEPIEEAVCGMDWDWWIMFPDGYWRRFFVQAKKLNPKTQRYEKIRYRSGGQFQLDKLREAAKQQGTIPLYCFYNWSMEVDPQCWHCPAPFDEKQLGCTLVPLEAVAEAFPPRKPKSFHSLHEDHRAIPWRCLFHQHPEYPKEPGGVAEFLCPKGYSPTRYKELPQVFRASDTDTVRLSGDEPEYKGLMGLLPRRILIYRCAED